MPKVYKRPCKKCGRAVVQSPLNPKVKLCDGCLDQPANCECKPVRSEAHYEIDPSTLGTDG